MAEGEKVPIVFLPRFTTLVGAQGYYTTPLDFLGFAVAQVTLWRGPYSGASPAAIAVLVEQSSDLVDWENLVTLTTPSSAGAQTVTKVEPTQRYLRVYVNQTADQSVTLWAAGYAERTTT